MKKQGLFTGILAIAFIPLLIATIPEIKEYFYYKKTNIAMEAIIQDIISKKQNFSDSLIVMNEKYILKNDIIFMLNNTLSSHNQTKERLENEILEQHEIGEDIDDRISEYIDEKQAINYELDKIASNNKSTRVSDVLPDIKLYSHALEIAEAKRDSLDSVYIQQIQNCKNYGLDKKKSKSN